MFFYSIILEKYNNIELRTYFFICLLIILVGFTGLRGNIDPDYINYLDIFNKAKIGENSGIEIGFYYLNTLIADLGLGFQWVIFLMAFITIFIKLQFFLKNSPNFVFSLFIYYCSIFYLYDFIAIRQALAMAIFMLALPYILYRKLIIYILLIVLASMFHISALILLPFYFILNFNYSRKLLLFILILVSIAILLKIKFIFTDILFNYLSLPVFAVEKIDVYSLDDSVATISLRQLILGYIFVLFLPKKDKKINIFLNIYIMGILLAVLLNAIPQLSFRIKSYFFWVESLLVIYCIDRYYNSYVLLKNIIYLLLSVIYMWSLYTFLDNVAQRGYGLIFPYKMFFE